MKFFGIDGCKAGWVYVELDDQGQWSLDVVKTEALAEIASNSRLALIDIPIGLLEGDGPHRQCDVEARKVLGWPRSSSVFAAPSRQAVYAHGYREACDRNFAALGRKISRQAWNIAKKIAEIDQLLIHNTGLQRRMRECHPEVCFWALNNGQAMQHNKKHLAGRVERLNVLAYYLPKASEILEKGLHRFRRKDVAADDIVDAMVCAVTAKLGFDCLSMLPMEPVRDAQGLSMEIVYWRALQPATCK